MKKGAVITLIILLILGAGGGAAVYWYTQGVKKYTGVYLPGTTINGKDVSMTTPESVETWLKEEAVQGEIVIHEKDGAEEKIARTDVISEVNLDTEPASLISEEELKKWPLSIRETRSYTIEAAPVYDDKMIAKEVGALSALDPKKMVLPEDAYFAKTENGYGVVPEKEGSLLNKDEVIAAVTAAIGDGSFETDLAANDCYVKPKITKDDPSFAPILAELDKIKNMSITIDLVEATEVIDYSVIEPWLVWDGKTFSVDQSLILPYVEEMDKKYRTYQTQRNFVTHSGETIVVGGGGGDTYGFWMDCPRMAERIYNTIVTWEPQTIDTAWKVNALTRDQENGDIGGTYIEVSIKEQHLWLYKGYELVFDSDVVTGKYSEEKRRTPTGVFCILRKLRDYTMSGTYGSQFCHYFLNFDWTGCAIHDASWRGSFGGDIYLDSGSHGCVNMPPEKAKELFDLVWTAMPVIIY